MYVFTAFSSLLTLTSYRLEMKQVNWLCDSKIQQLWRFTVFRSNACMQWDQHLIHMATLKINVFFLLHVCSSDDRLLEWCTILRFYRLRGMSSLWKYHYLIWFLEDPISFKNWFLILNGSIIEPELYLVEHIHLLRQNSTLRLKSLDAALDQHRSLMGCSFVHSPTKSCWNLSSSKQQTTWTMKQPTKHENIISK